MSEIMKTLYRCIWIMVVFQIVYVVVLLCIKLTKHSAEIQQENVDFGIISLRKSKHFHSSINRAKNSTRNQETSQLFDNVSIEITRGISSTTITDLIERSTESSTIIKSTWFTTFLLIMIPILPSSFRSREMIRNTWYKGFSDSEDVMLRFAMGIKGVDANTTKLLADENSTHKDLIFFENLKENRSALTNKTLLLMKWAYANINFTYFLKCDDDTFVFVKRTLNELKKRSTTERLYYGIIISNSRPKRDKYWADLEWDQTDTYLPFALGGGYFLSSDLVSLIVEDGPFLKKYPNEDTAVGIWLAPYKYERRTDKLICIMFFSRKSSKRCPRYHIMHLFFGLSRDELDRKFFQYSEQL